jgi:hypothetical protein
VQLLGSPLSVVPRVAQKDVAKFRLLRRFRLNGTTDRRQ